MESSCSQPNLNGFRIRKLIQTLLNERNLIVDANVRAYLHLYKVNRPLFPSLESRVILFSSLSVGVFALLGLLGGRGEVGRVGRHGELFLDAGDGHGTSYSAGFCLDWEDIPSLSFSSVCLFLRRAGWPNARMGSTLT